MDKVCQSAACAVADIPSGATIAVGGFGLSGIPSVLIQALREHGANDLELISNNAGVDDWGLGLLLNEHRVRRIVASYVGENREFARQYLSGELEVELSPQGTLAERLRSAGAGVPGFFTPTGAGTLVADGGVPWRYDTEGNAVVESPRKETRLLPTWTGEVECVFERAIYADFALLRAARGDRLGNLEFHSSARNFNPVVAMAGRVAIAEVEELVEPGELLPDRVHLPGIYVQRVVELTSVQRNDKRIERLVVSEGRQR